MKILIVDDSPTDRTLLARILQKTFKGIELIMAEDGRVALDVLKKQSDEVGLVFLDLQMPRIDGLELMRLMRKQPSWAKIPTLMISSACEQDQKDIVGLINPDLVGYLVKPVDSQALINKVKMYINK